VAAGVGLFISFLGLRDAGVVVPNAATIVTIGNLRDPKTMLAIAGLVAMAALLARGVKAAVLIGVVGTTVAGLLTRQIEWQPQATRFSDLSATAFRLDLAGTLHLGLLEIAFVFLFVDLFDNIGTLLAVGRKAGLVGSAGRIPRANRIFTADALATIVGSCCGTSTVTSYIESAAGVRAGGRTGLVGLVVAILFLVSLFLAPLAQTVPAYATAPALLFVGCLMARGLSEIDWEDVTEYAPAVVTALAMPFTFSIANGIALGFISYAAVKLLSGRFGEARPAIVVLAALFVVRYWVLPQ
jgi:AGZA family xanthine/uracil permease-like MFS transporter